MRKPWSISTAVRNPERLIKFLEIAKEMQGKIWNTENQVMFQKLLIKKRYYGFGSNLFIDSLSDEHAKIFCDAAHKMTLEEAQAIFEEHGYEDPPMRGRQSMSPLRRLGLVSLTDDIIEITEAGNIVLDNSDKLGEVLLKSLLKWQCPNLIEKRGFTAGFGFNIIPFVATIIFMDRVNSCWVNSGKNRKGLSKYEFELFVPLLIDYRQIDEYVKKLIDLRLSCEHKNIQEQKDIREGFKKAFITEFLQTENNSAKDKTIKNLKDYADNIIRYFRLTKFIKLRGSGFYIDLEEERVVEINSIIEKFSAKPVKFNNAADYQAYLADYNQPELPWEERSQLAEILRVTIADINKLERIINRKRSEFSILSSMGAEELKMKISEARDYRNELYLEKLRLFSRQPENIRVCLEKLKDISNLSAVELEKYVTIGLNAINDALRIKPNYPMGDDGEPTTTASGGKADIECYYRSFNSICEVTKLRRRDQWFNEGQPVMRHLREFENQNAGENYCLFIAPVIHRDTLNTFWHANKYEYEGKRQKIIPLTIGDFAGILQVLLIILENDHRFSHLHLKRLFKNIVELVNEVLDSQSWLETIRSEVDTWKNNLRAEYGC